MRHALPLLTSQGMMSLPKSRLELGRRRRGADGRELRRLEDIDAHGGERHVRVAGNGWRILRLLDEGGDAVLLVHRHDAEARRPIAAADGDVGTRIDVLLHISS